VVGGSNPSGHRSPDAGNYLRGDERVDFIYASRPAARGLLSNAATIQTAFGEVRVVSTEGLIGLKLQGFVNNPRRTQDLFAADGGITHVPAEATSREPFEVLDDLMTVIEALCPVWPNREIFSSTDRFLGSRQALMRPRDSTASSYWSVL
jgi:hypothetical protein